MWPAISCDGISHDQKSAYFSTTKAEKQKLPFFLNSTPNSSTTTTAATAQELIFFNRHIMQWQCGVLSGHHPLLYFPLLFLRAASYLAFHTRTQLEPIMKNNTNTIAAYASRFFCTMSKTSIFRWKSKIVSHFETGFSSSQEFLVGIGLQKIDTSLVYRLSCSYACSSRVWSASSMALVLHW